MRIRFWHRRAEAERLADEAEHLARAAKAKHHVVDARWPEVHELARWARETREANHLTQLFIANLRGSRS